jgi:hypothetical protein
MQDIKSKKRLIQVKNANCSFKEHAEMASKFIERRSIFLVIIEVQVKITGATTSDLFV